MQEVECDVENVMLPAGDVRSVPGVRVTCRGCGHVVESFGQRGRSLRRCLKALEEECPREETNTYKKYDGHRKDDA
jgi:hypothetical protein